MNLPQYNRSVKCTNYELIGLVIEARQDYSLVIFAMSVTSTILDQIVSLQRQTCETNIRFILTKRSRSFYSGSLHVIASFVLQTNVEHSSGSL